MSFVLTRIKHDKECIDFIRLTSKEEKKEAEVLIIYGYFIFIFFGVTKVNLARCLDREQMPR